MVDGWGSCERGRPASWPSSCWRPRRGRRPQLPAAARTSLRFRWRSVLSGSTRVRWTAWKGRAPRWPYAASSAAPAWPPTRSVGPLTRRALGRRGRPAVGSRRSRDRRPRLGRRGPAVPAGLARLSFRGDRRRLGAHTEAALVRYQRWAGLPADGRAGPGRCARWSWPHRGRPRGCPFPWRAAVGDRFGPRGDRFHSGIDLLAAAAAAGARGRRGDGQLRRLGLRRLWQPGRHRPRQRREQLVRASVAPRCHVRCGGGDGDAGGVGRGDRRRQAARICISRCACATRSPTL